MASKVAVLRITRLILIKTEPHYDIITVYIYLYCILVYGVKDLMGSLGGGNIIPLKT